MGFSPFLYQKRRLQLDTAYVGLIPEAGYAYKYNIIGSACIRNVGRSNNNKLCESVLTTTTVLILLLFLCTYVDVSIMKTL